MSADLLVLRRQFHYLHEKLGFSREDIVTCPVALERYLLRLKKRHGFLKHIDRAQYDSTKPNYIPLSALCKMSDDSFWEQYAKDYKEQYYYISDTL